MRVISAQSTELFVGPPDTSLQLARVSVSPSVEPTLVRIDGRVMREMYLAQVKSPAESKYPFDYLKILQTIPRDEAFRPLKDGGCPLVK